MASIRSTVFLGSQPAVRPHPVESDSIRRFRILVLGDFSGRASRGVSEPSTIGARAFVRFDPDEMESAFRVMAPQIELPSPWDTKLSFDEVDDLRPEALVRSVSRFGELRDLAVALRSGRGVEKVRRALRSDGESSSSTPSDGSADKPASDGGSLLDQALGVTESQAGPVRDAGDLVDKLLSEFVAPHLVPEPDTSETELAQEIEVSVGAAMRGLLREPALSELESNWMAVELLVRRLELDERLRIDLVDISRAELLADADATAEGSVSQFDRLIERVLEPEGTATVVLALDPVGDSVESVEHLALLARAGLPVLASATATLATGSVQNTDADPEDWTQAPSEIEDAWSRLRSSEPASRIAAFWPGPLRRQPFGRASAPVDGLDFEEFEPGQGLDQLPWSGAAVLAAISLGVAWSEFPDDRQPMRAARSGGWPVFLAPGLDGDEAVSTTRVALGARGADRAGDRGLSVLWSVRGTDDIEIGAFRSIASAGQRFEGPFGPI